MKGHSSRLSAGAARAGLHGSPITVTRPAASAQGGFFVARSTTPAEALPFYLAHACPIPAVGVVEGDVIGRNSLGRIGAVGVRQNGVRAEFSSEGGPMIGSGRS